jgi:hypothetical protein
MLLGTVPVGDFTRSYESLGAYVRWYEYGAKSIEQIITRPGKIGADMSPLAAILDDSDHAGQVHLPDEDLRRIHIWLDGNAPFYGTYSRDEQQAQHRGEAVALPEIQ